MARSTWKGAIEFIGFPVNVALYNRVKSRSSGSFKTLGTDDKPIHQVLITDTEFVKLEAKPATKVAVIPRDKTRKGVATGKDTWQALSDAAVEQINGAERSVTVTPRSFVPRDTVPLELANTAYVVTHDHDVAGAEQSVNVLWNGLRESGLAYTTEVVTRAGSRDSILVLYADDEGLYAAALPFAEELNDCPSGSFTHDDKAAAMFATMVENEYQVNESWEHDSYGSVYLENRADVIKKVMAGKTIEAPVAPVPEVSTGGLMDALEVAVSAAPASKAKSKAKKPAKRSKARA